MKETLLNILNSSLLKYLMIVTIAILIFSNLFKNCNNRYTLEDVNNLTDTIYSVKYLPSLPEYKFITMPGKVYFYKPREGPKVDSVTLNKDTIKLYVRDTLEIEVNTSFLTLYPNHSKLIQFELSKNNLKLDLFNKDGIEYREEYKINTDRNNYRYVDNRLSLEPKLISRFEFNSEYFIRPIENMHDMNLNLSLKTGRITYIGGLNLYYYPKLDNNINLTPILGIRYTP